MRRKYLHFQCHQGFGDNIYELPFVERFAQLYELVFVQTPFPWLYKYLDLENLRFVPPETRLPTQLEHMKLFEQWVDLPLRDLDFFSFVGLEAKKPEHKETRLERMCAASGFHTCQLPQIRFSKFYRDVDATILMSIKPNAALVKPPTLRKCDLRPARNPADEEFEILMDYLYPNYSLTYVGHLRFGENWEKTGSKLFKADQCLLDGTLNLFCLLHLLPRYKFVVGSPSWLIPAAMITEARAFFVYGGCEPPHYHGIDSYSRHIGYAAPEPFCGCWTKDHCCPKKIDGLLDHFQSFKRMVLNASDEVIRNEKN